MRSLDQGVSLFNIPPAASHFSAIQYLDLVLHLLDVVADAPESELSLPQKINFIHEAQQTFGRTALVLGGGAAFGMPGG